MAKGLWASLDDGGMTPERSPGPVRFFEERSDEHVKMEKGASSHEASYWLSELWWRRDGEGFREDNRGIRYPIL